MTNIPHLNIMKKAAASAVKKITRDFGELAILQISRNSTANFIDKTLEKIRMSIFQELKSAYPESYVTFYGDEEKVFSEKTIKFVIIPIDGLQNFSRHIGFFSIIVMRYERLKEDEDFILTSIVIDSPLNREIFAAEKNHGAWRESYDTGDMTRLKITDKAHKEIFNISESDVSINFNCASLHIAYFAASRVDNCTIKKSNPYMVDIAQLFAYEISHYECTAKLVINDDYMQLIKQTKTTK